MITALRNHIKKTKHQFNFDRVKIIDREPNLCKRYILEMVYIKQDDTVKNKINISCLSNIYKNVL